MTKIEWSTITGILRGMSVEYLSQKFERQKRVQLGLKYLGFNGPPPYDFAVVYIYTLVEYGMDKPKSIVEVFRHKVVRDLFQNWFNNKMYDETKLEEVVEQLFILPWFNQTFGTRNVNIRQVVVEFADIFYNNIDHASSTKNVTKTQKVRVIWDKIEDDNTTIPKDTHFFVKEEMNTIKHMLTQIKDTVVNIRQDISEQYQSDEYLDMDIHEQLDEMRETVEIFEDRMSLMYNNFDNELGQQVESLLSIIMQAMQDILQRTILQKFPDSVTAKELYPIFEKLGYTVEHAYVKTDYFQWIVTVPIKTSQHQVLVHGIDGLANMEDFNALVIEVENIKVDEGWLVTNRRVTRAVREAVQRERYKHLSYHTIHELKDWSDKA